MLEESHQKVRFKDKVKSMTSLHCLITLHLYFMEFEQIQNGKRNKVVFVLPQPHRGYTRLWEDMALHLSSKLVVLFKSMT